MVAVVNMRTCNPPWGQRGDVRVDRASKWGNPYPLLLDTRENRACVISKYEVWLDSQIQLGLLDLSELKDAKRLGCWCKPKQCHGDIIKRKLDETDKLKQRKFNFEE